MLLRCPRIDVEMVEHNKWYSLANGEVEVYVDRGICVHLRCETQQGDPVEFGKEQFEVLLAALHEVAEELERVTPERES